MTAPPGRSSGERSRHSIKNNATEPASSPSRRQATHTVTPLDGCGHSSAGGATGPPNREEAPNGAPSTAPTDPRQKDHPKNTGLGPVGRALLAAIEANTVNLDDIPPEKLAAPSLGAIRRQAGHTNEWCDEARIAFAVELTREAQRRILMERLDGIMQFIAVGATPDQAVTRIERLTAEYRGKAA